MCSWSLRNTFKQLLTFRSLLLVKYLWLAHWLILYLIYFCILGGPLLLLALDHTGSFELFLILVLLRSSFRSLRLLWLLLWPTTIVHYTWHLRDSGDLWRWLVVVILIILLILPLSPFSFLVLLSHCPLLVLFSLPLTLPHRILVMDLHLLLHLLHHLLHTHSLSFVFTMNLLFNLLLNIHVFHGSRNSNHSLKVVHSFPEFFKGMILY